MVDLPLPEVQELELEVDDVIPTMKNQLEDRIQTKAKVEQVRAKND